MCIICIVCGMYLSMDHGSFVLCGIDMDRCCQPLSPTICYLLRAATTVHTPYMPSSLDCLE